MTKPPALPVEDVPANLLRKLNADARRQGRAVYDVAGAILAHRLGTDHVTNGSRYTGGITGERMTLYVTVELRQLLRVEAATAGGTIRGVVLAHLAAHYGLKPPSTGRRR